MQNREYRQMYELEDTYWWYRGLDDLLGHYINAMFHGREGLRLLDAGCGTGRVLEKLRLPGAVGMDFSAEALEFCRKRNLSAVLQASVSAMPFADNSFDIIVSLDVLYHKGIADDSLALAEFHRVLASGGNLMMNLPAFEFLRSAHDEAIHGIRRYTKKSLKRKIEDAGFGIRAIFYRNTLLFPLAAVSRLLHRLKAGKGEIPESDLKPVSPVVNSWLERVLFLENRMLLKGISFPWGLSIFVAAEKR